MLTVRGPPGPATVILLAAPRAVPEPEPSKGVPRESNFRMLLVNV
jgi:hypothetical protein